MGLYLKKCKVIMQVETGANSAVISSKIWTELVKPRLDGKIRHLQAYDGHQLTRLGALSCDVELKGSRLTQKELAVGSPIMHSSYLVENFYPSTLWATPQRNIFLLWRDTKLIWSWCHDQNQCSAVPEKYLYLLKTRSQRSWKTGHSWTGTAGKSH